MVSESGRASSQWLATAITNAFWQGAAGRGQMIDGNSTTSVFTVVRQYAGPVWQYAGPLIGVGFGYLISNKVWGWQKRWELRRDAVLDAIRSLADLESALVNLNSCLRVYISIPENKLTDKTNAEVSAASQRFRGSRTSFWCAHRIADLAVGGQFSNALSAYFRSTGAVSKDLDQKRFLDGAKYKELALRGNDVILSARQALKIKDAGDLIRLDDSN